MSAVFSFIVARLAEPSTWAGIAIVAQGVGNAVTTKDWGSIAQSVAGAIAILAPEKSVK